jgi:predicted dehydrogenase
MNSNENIRLAVIGAGAFGRNHLRVIRTLENATLAGVLDADPARAEAASAEFGCRSFAAIGELAAAADAVVIAAPTSVHAELGCQAAEMGLDLLVEKPIARSIAEAEQLIATAGRHQRILMCGHLERFNPAVAALEARKTRPLFFEIHRMSVFTPRSLDVDVVLDLMIHDLEILLALTGDDPEEIRAAGIRILSRHADIANVRLQFPGGCVANLTASRASTEKVRKLRLFQPHEYLSLDYSRQDLTRIRVGDNQAIQFEQVPIVKNEPLKAELEHFVHCVRTRQTPRVSGTAAARALRLGLEIAAAIEDHGRLVFDSLAAHEAKEPAMPPAASEV